MCIRDSDDAAVFLQHLRQLGLEPVGELQYRCHLGVRLAARQGHQQAQRWQRELIFLDEMRVHQASQCLGCLTDFAAGLGGPTQPLVQRCVFALQRLGDGELLSLIHI